MSRTGITDAGGAALRPVPEVLTGLPAAGAVESNDCARIVYTARPAPIALPE
ncbi:MULTISPECIES: hypothetical protein [unclassified Variovorax]|uniref:hypothetical protein n=1 Tax=unclassified Variovorax TaxID=663243 RepID=UPI00076C5FCF|nr:MULTISPECIES: hypothetical protein [unclassified Variovorax]KWT91640.1 hypothetical protein APY03_3251 [Variovorax sp. WDL1]PNG49020.1 hypothetical protein CHC07_06662 [Variovorax sp. B4]PNG49702.1 hypothetical protein CHC06_05283 [Variovorax sp. B2]VTV18601.1 hypothetical protein WDL1P2_00283 [Variovorax sp. WDL1]